MCSCAPMCMHVPVASCMHARACDCSVSCSSVRIRLAFSCQLCVVVRCCCCSALAVSLFCVCLDLPQSKFVQLGSYAPPPTYRRRPSSHWQRYKSTDTRQRHTFTQTTQPTTRNDASQERHDTTLK